MHQFRGLQCLAGLFAGHLAGCEPAQLVIDEHEQLVRGVRLAAFHRVQNGSRIAQWLWDCQIRTKHSPANKIRPIHASVGAKAGRNSRLLGTFVGGIGSGRSADFLVRSNVLLPDRAGLSNAPRLL